LPSETCPAGSGGGDIIPIPPKETIDDWQISFTFGMYFIMGCVFIVGSVLITIGAFVAWRFEQRQTKGTNTVYIPQSLKSLRTRISLCIPWNEGVYMDDESKEPGLFHRLGQKSEKLINRSFTYIGESETFSVLVLRINSIQERSHVSFQK